MSVINYDVDVIKKYASKRKGISEKEVEELFKSMVSFLKSKLENERLYAINIPEIGTLHRKIEDIDSVMKREAVRSLEAYREEDMLINIIYNRNSPIIKKPIYKHYEEEDFIVSKNS